MSNTKQFATISDYLEIINEFPKIWHTFPNTIWFRGVENSDYKLVPGIVWRGLRKYEDHVTRSFLINYRNYWPHQTYDPFELYSLMQHFGLPTRLLDWTSSPLVGFYFALEKSLKVERMKNMNNQNAIVWVLCPHKLNEIHSGAKNIYTPNRNEDDVLPHWLPIALKEKQDINDKIPNHPIAVKFPHANQRISSQQGCFTFHGLSDDCLSESFKGLDEYEQQYLIKLELSASSNKMDLMKELYSLGYTEDAIYQDLNSLSERIVRELEQFNHLIPSGGLYI